RWKEFGAKARELVSAAFGEKVADMMEIQVLATDPDAQGRGYASALVKYVLRQSDADGRDTWLVTSDAYTFYQRLGFSVVGTTYIGSNNPAWDRDPVPMYVVSVTSVWSR
ncbi:hypothetical protein DICSQDRAFT_61087, partial [Dichomitus squalens LYAD-421 SS1]